VRKTFGGQMNDTKKFTLEKMRNLILKSEMCRKDKNCGGCENVNFCAIWTGHWPAACYDGSFLEAYSECKVKDLPVSIVSHISKFTDKTLYKLVSYMNENDLLFDNEQDYTDFYPKKENEHGFGEGAAAAG
jgi:hypothetical protein